MSDQTCGNCKWAKGFSTTPTGRFKKDTFSYCDCPVPEPVLPKCITSAYGYRVLNNLPRNAVYPHDADCPTWEAKVDT